MNGAPAVLVGLYVWATRRYSAVDLSQDHVQRRELNNHCCAVEEGSGQVDANGLFVSDEAPGRFLTVLPSEIGSIKARKRHSDHKQTQEIGDCEDPGGKTL